MREPEQEATLLADELNCGSREAQPASVPKSKGRRPESNTCMPCGLALGRLGTHICQWGVHEKELFT